MTEVCVNYGRAVFWRYNPSGSRFAPPLSPVSGYGAGPGRFPRERGKPDWRVGYLRLSRYSCIVASVGG